MSTLDPDSPRRVDPLRTEGRLLGEQRKTALAETNRITTAMAELERQIHELAGKLRSLRATRKQLHDRLYPNTLRRGRQPKPDGSVALPPAREDAQRLWGRRLRAVCRTMLERAGELSLVDLHALLHHHGYVLANENHVKALADALGYDTDIGRVRRVARGVYAAA